MDHLTAENHTIDVRRRLLGRFCRYLDMGFRDFELLYLGARYAVSLRMAKTACRFLDLLSEMLCRDTASPAYFPIGLLHLQVLPDGEKRKLVLQRLQALARNSPDLVWVLESAGLAEGESPDSSPHKLLAEIASNPAEKVPALGESGKTSDTSLQEFRQLCKAAKEAYIDGNMGMARNSLEKILARDGDQPEVLQNLVLIAGEEQDIEAYERYWRRYVKVQLWRIMRGESPENSRMSLSRFYERAARAMNRDLGKSINETVQILQRPGFTPRWLESHLGLAWSSLEDVSRLGDAERFQIMRHWCRMFYPEFFPFLVAQDLKNDRESASPAFDPVLQLLTSFMKWAPAGFGVRDSESVYGKTIVAFALSMAYLPVKNYAGEIAGIARESYPQVGLRRAVQEACFNPLLNKAKQFGGGQFADEKKWDWQAMADFFGAPELAGILHPLLRMCLAAAFSKTGREQDGLEIACAALPDFLPEELAEQNLPYFWWTRVLELNARQAIQDKENWARLKQKIKAIPDTESLAPLKKKSLEELPLYAVLEQRQKAIGFANSGNFDSAVEILKEIRKSLGADAPDETRKDIENNLVICLKNLAFSKYNCAVERVKKKAAENDKLNLKEFYNIFNSKERIIAFFEKMDECACLKNFRNEMYNPYSASRGCSYYNFTFPSGKTTRLCENCYSTVRTLVYGAQVKPEHVSEEDKKLFLCAWNSICQAEQFAPQDEELQKLKDVLTKDMKALEVSLES